MRLDKFLSNMKYGTRNEVSKQIKKGHVLLNGTVCKDSKLKIKPESDIVTIHGEDVFYKETVLLMLNKPAGYISANTDGLHKTVLELITEPYSRFDLSIAGRLDIDTEGLLLLTNNGQLLHDIISPNKNVYKTYFVRVNEGFDPSLLLKEYEILDGRNHPYIPALPKVKRISDTEFELSIKEGKFHQVKRMVSHFERTVIYLKRISIGNLVLDETLPLGEFKEVNQKNI